jgi:hypothetical protein
MTGLTTTASHNAVEQEQLAYLARAEVNTSPLLFSGADVRHIPSLFRMLSPR